MQKKVVWRLCVVFLGGAYGVAGWYKRQHPVDSSVVTDGSLYATVCMVGRFKKRDGLFTRTRENIFLAAVPLQNLIAIKGVLKRYQY